MKRILFCTGEGIGNVVQTLPTIRTLKEVLGYTVDMWHAFGSFSVPKIFPCVDKWYSGNQVDNIFTPMYVGKVSTFWTRRHIESHHKVRELSLRNKIIPLSMTRSEVDTYMDIARDLGVKEEDILWTGNILFGKTEQTFDIVIHNGYNPVGSANWRIKSYPHYDKVAELLTKSGFTVCSIGSKKEYINGTVDRTGLTLNKTLGVINNCKLFLGNDSGMYHCATGLEIPNVVVFTATSIEKNFDSRFHKYTTIVGRDDLKCRPCQAGRRWSKDCKTWDCQQVDSNNVFKTVKKILED